MVLSGGGEQGGIVVLSDGGELGGIVVLVGAVAQHGIVILGYAGELGGIVVLGGAVAQHGIVVPGDKGLGGMELCAGAGMPKGSKLVPLNCGVIVLCSIMRHYIAIYYNMYFKRLAKGTIGLPLAVELHIEDCCKVPAYIHGGHGARRDP